MSTLLKLCSILYFGISAIDLSAGKSSFTIEIKTPDVYRYLPRSQFICLHENQVLSLHVKACHDAYIAIMSTQRPEELMYEVVIDRFKDNATVIRRRKGATVKTVAEQNHESYLQCGEFIRLSIKIDGKELFIQGAFRNADSETIINSTYTDMPSSVYVTVATGFGATGIWRFQFWDTGTSDDECGKEILVITGCKSDDNTSCRNCKVASLFKKDITNECQGNSRHLFLMSDESCSLYNQSTVYVTAVHFMYAPNVSTIPSSIPSTPSTRQTISVSSNSYSSSVSPTVSSVSISIPSTLSTRQIISTPSISYSSSVSPTTASANQPSEVDQSSSKDTIIGISIGITVIVVILVVLSGTLFVLKRRHNNGDEKVDRSHTANETDYTGNQNIALAGTRASTDYVHANTVDENHVYHEIQSVQNGIATSYDYIDIPDPKSESNFTNNANDTENVCSGKVQEQYDIANPIKTDREKIDINPIGKGDDEIKKKLTAVPAMSKFNTAIKESKMDETDSTYFALDPKSTGFDRSQPSPKSYEVLDPNETGYNRSQDVKDNTGVYELAKPIDVSDKEDNKSKESSLNNNGNCGEPLNDDYKAVKKQLESNISENIYHHTIDNVYDTAFHTQEIHRQEDTYDHFHDQKD